MLEFIKAKFRFKDNKNRKSPQGDSAEIKKNPINELQVLEGHTDIVRIIILVNENR